MSELDFKEKIPSEQKVELMCPAGSFEALRAAIKAGAGSVYFGIGNLNMRSRSAKFSYDDLDEIVSICNTNNVRSYITLNTVMYNDDLSEMKKICDLAKKKGVSAVIASDISVINYARSIDLEVHMSTQANISNIEAVKFYSKFADVIVLARELSLEQIKEIVTQIKKEEIKGPSGKLIEVEVFVHGALCVAVSGKCYMSLAQYNYSANRGACLQTCRRRYKVTDIETGDELEIDNNYIMSPKDLSTITMVDKLIEAGVSIFKIEGRARGPEYVYTVTKAYKDAVDAVYKKKYNENLTKDLTKSLKKVFNRGFWERGYYLGKRLGEWSGTYGSKATTKKVLVGKIVHFFNKNNVAEILVESKKISVGDLMMITGKTTGIIYQNIEKIIMNDKEVDSCNSKQKCTIKLPERARVNDKVYIIEKR